MSDTSGLRHEALSPVPDLHDVTRAMPRVMRDLRELADQFGTECLGVVIEAIANPRQPEAVDV